MRPRKFLDSDRMCGFAAHFSVVVRVRWCVGFVCVIRVPVWSDRVSRVGCRVSVSPVLLSRLRAPTRAPPPAK
jgi:hypothetical protein